MTTRVLVIDDEAPIRLLCRVSLEAAGMRVLEAPDGALGVDAACRELPDLTLLGVMMPRLDGWAVAGRLGRDGRTRDIPFIFLTARSTYRDRLRGLELGAVDYMTKPFNPLDLPARIEATLARTSRGEGEALRRENIAAIERLIAEDPKGADGPTDQGSSHE